MKAIELIGKGKEMHNRGYIESDKNEADVIIKKLKENGFNHFVMLSCIDWIDENIFELVYHLWSYKYREHVMVSVKLSREKPSMKSMSDIFPQIETYEREIYEMYGINFNGNTRLKSFLLDGWHDIPPMRKDFDSKKFTEEVFDNIPLIDED